MGYKEMIKWIEDKIQEAEKKRFTFRERPGFGRTNEEAMFAGVYKGQYDILIELRKQLNDPR